MTGSAVCSEVLTPTEGFGEQGQPPKGVHTRIHTESAWSVGSIEELAPNSKCAECCIQVWGKLDNGLRHSGCSHEASSEEPSVRLRPCWQPMLTATAPRAGGLDPHVLQGRPLQGGWWTHPTFLPCSGSLFHSLVPTSKRTKPS